MAERGALPAVPARRRVMLRAARAFFTPLLPDDYLEMINPCGRRESCAGESCGSSSRREMPPR
jgi:hypothetical protein